MSTDKDDSGDAWNLYQLDEVDDARDDPASQYGVEIPGTPDGGDRVPDLSPREARDRWIDRLRGSKRESTVTKYHYRTKQFVEWCEANDIEHVNDLTGWGLDSFETARRGDGLKITTLNRQMGTVKRFLKYCARIDLVDEGLPEKIDPPDVPPEERSDDTMLHPDDAKQLLQYYRETAGARHSRAHALLSLAWYTGARLGALRGLDLNDYNSEDELVRFRHRPEEGTPLKNGYDGERPVGLPAEVCETLDGYIATNRHEKYDDHGRAPLLTSEIGRASTNAIRAWMYLATVPCLYTDCPHGNDRETCEYVDYSHASKCPSSRSPHQIRTGSITWQRNRSVPPEVVSERVNSSVRVIEEHYDKPTQREEMEQRRRQHLDRLEFDGGDDDQ